MNRKPAKAKHEHDDEEWDLPANLVEDGSGTDPEEIAENAWAATGHHPIANPEYLDDIRRSEEILRHASGDTGLPPLMDPDDFDPGR